MNYTLPLVYNSYNIYLIGNSIPEENSLAIISQWQYIQVIVEIIQESIIFPIFFFVGGILKSDNHKLIERRISTSIKIILLAITPIVIILTIYVKNLVDYIDTPNEIINSTISYLRIKIWTLVITVCNLGLVIIIESLNKKRYLITLLICKMTLYIIFDSFLFGEYHFSLGLGIKGVALSNLIVESILITFIIIHLRTKLNLNIFREFNTLNLFDFKIFKNISIGIGIESTVKNIAYLTMIITLINSLGPKQIGGYYLSMHLFWSILLTPIIALNETLKVLIANNSNKLTIIKSLLKYGIMIGAIVVSAWILLLPFIDNIFTQFNNDKEVISFARIAFGILLIPYMIMSINMIIDSIFYGLGVTKYLAYQSIITNILVYFSAYTLYKIEIWIPSFISILCLFSIGILIDSILTVIYMKHILRNRDFTSPNKSYCAHAAHCGKRHVV